MKRTTVLVLAIAIGTACAPAPSARTPIAITGATLIDGTGTPPIADATIVIDGETVIAVGTDIVIPPNARRISARGRWVIPGMIDLHVHFWESARPGAQPTFVADLTKLFPYDQEVQWMKSRVAFTLSRYLCSGVTSVAVLGAIPWEYEVRAQAETLSSAPRVFIAGGVIQNSPVEEGFPLWEGKARGYSISQPQDVAPLLDSLTASRIDLVKAVFALRPRTEPSDLARQLREFVPPLTELIRDSHARGYRVAVHAGELMSAKAALTAGADVLAHTVWDHPVDEDFLTLARRQGTTSISTIGPGYGYARLKETAFVAEPPEVSCGDPEVASAWRLWDSLPPAQRPPLPEWIDPSPPLATVLENVRRMHLAGIPLAVGSDGGNIGTQHGPGFQRELRLLAKAGLTPMEVIVAATRNGARALGVDNRLGTLQVGRSADLLILDADPLLDIANLDRITDVMARGRLIARRALGKTQPH